MYTLESAMSFDFGLSSSSLSFKGASRNGYKRAYVLDTGYSGSFTIIGQSVQLSFVQLECNDFIRLWKPIVF